jgi:5-methyltetrahydrofolate--homocysteine methyltransferase
MQEVIVRIKDAVVEGRHKEIEAFVREATAEGIPPSAIMNDGLIAAMDEVGKRFEAGEIFVPEMLVSALTMKRGLYVMKPLLTVGGNASEATILMATVKGDLHDIGKNIVVMMLEGANFRVIDLGVDVNVARVVESVAELKPDILGLSALLTTTMPEMKNVIETLKAKGLRDSVRVMIGGAPVDDAFAERIGADGYGKDAVAAVGLARRFLKH